MKKTVLVLLIGLNFGQILPAGEEKPKTPMEEKIEYIKSHKEVFFVGLGVLAMVFALGAVYAAPTIDTVGLVHFWGDGSQKKHFVALKGKNFFPTLVKILKWTVFPYGTDHPGKIAGAALTWIVGVVGIIIIGEYIVNQNKSLAVKLSKIGRSYAAAGKDFFFPSKKAD